MCDHQYDAYPWTNFYQHYLQQHAIMTQHFQKLNNLDSYFFGYGTCYCDSHNPADVHSAREYSSCSSCSSSSESHNSNTFSSEYEMEQDAEEPCEEDESEYEYELNVDAILAMRAAKEELKKESTSESESIVLIDSDKEEFEFVELGSINTLESKLSHNVGSSRNRNEEMHTQKKIMEYLYGDKSSTIAGLETAMAVNFERLCDINQPPLWPVLPVRL